VAKQSEWRERIKAWRRSGQTSDEFCRGEDYAAGLLRHWAWRLGLTRRRRETRLDAAAPRLARVVRVKALPVVVDERRAAIRIEIGRARIDVPAGINEAALVMVLRALERVASATTEGQP
jgi:hypothetical protein